MENLDYIFSNVHILMFMSEKSVFGIKHALIIMREFCCLANINVKNTMSKLP